jgi:predicted DNA-binding transcriptional regulator YafY
MSLAVDRTERFYRIDQLLQSRKPVVPVSDFLTELGVSLATFKRDLEYMRDRLHAPIIWDRDQNGYRFAEQSKQGPKYELPGLWFNPSEAQALLTMEHLIESLEPTLLGKYLEPLKTRLAALLSSGDHSIDEVRHRIRILTLGTRRHEPKHFSLVASAVLTRQRLRLTYYNRMKDEVSTREISPQRLVHYRNNWYLDGYCHERKGIRSFALDAMKDIAIEPRKAKDIPDRELNEFLSSGYGIFSGTNVKWAELRFSPAHARYVSLGEWHSKQKSRFEPDGTYVLEIPYTDDKELIMDILRYGPNVTVVRPQSLRETVASLLKASAALYE